MSSRFSKRICGTTATLTILAWVTAMFSVPEAMLEYPSGVWSLIAALSFVLTFVLGGLTVWGSLGIAVFDLHEPQETKRGTSQVTPAE